MKWLTAIKLVNWHYFRNETLRLGGCTLLTGDNGSGKSTILDAIQFALIGDARRVRFNISAHDETRRALDGYLRCKTGVEQGDGGAGYLRSGDFTTYIALEFRDTRRGRPFLIGCGIDSYAAGTHDPPLFFKLEDTALSDHLFLDGGRPYSARREFRPLIQNLKGSTVYPSAEQYRGDVLARFGHLSPRFFDLLIKALAFHPITNVRQFVYDYVLDPRSLNVDAMRENLQQYRHFEQLVQQTTVKIQALQQICAVFDEKRQWEDRIAIQDYVILRARREQAQEERERQERERDELLERARAAAAELERLGGDQERLRRRLHDLMAALAADSTYQLARRLDDEINQLNTELAELTRRQARLAAEAAAEVAALDNAVGTLVAEPELGVPEGSADLDTMTGAAHLLAPLVRRDPGAPVPSAGLQELAAAAERLAGRVAERRHEIRTEQAALAAEGARLRTELDALERHRLTYPEYVTDLQRLIAEEAGGAAEVLCELLEIPNERWQNAVEGYLHTQRFDLIVRPDLFDAALSVYEQRKEFYRLHSVGLVNTAAVAAGAREPRPGSLAAEVQTANPYARAYMYRLLGRVMKAETEQELKQHDVAITPTCMTYRNRTARQIRPDVYDMWYIGERAFSRQRELKEARLKAVMATLERLRALDQLAEQVLQALKDKRTWYVAVLAPAWEQVMVLPERAGALARKREERAALDLTQVADLQRQKEQAEADIKSAEEQVRAQMKARADAEAQAEVKESALAEHSRAWYDLHQQLEAFVGAQPAVAEQGAARYQEERRSRSNQTIAEGYARNRASLASRIENLQGDLLDLRQDYNRRYQFGGSVRTGDNAAYADELHKLTDSELPAYAGRITATREAAEQEFKEHFIYRLQEYISEAKKQFRDLNHVLQQIAFGQDRYQFVVSASHSHHAAHDMITDPLAVEGPSLFAGAFREKHQAALDDLFTAILDPDAAQQAHNIQQYTDYRTYLDFDIRIHHDGGETTLFSRVLREKSGGETQTPFYVAIVASFLQMYRPGNQDSARLMLFDEAFNRMDPDRAENTLRFIRKLGLQVLAAAPTDKCEIITPHVETTLLVMREGHQTWVEDYHQIMAAPAPEAEAEAAATGEPS